MKGSGDFMIGGTIWPGLSKLIEECGETMQVGGKLIGSAGEEQHWDGSNLRERMQEELADLEAAILFAKQHWALDTGLMTDRTEKKLALFNQWHREVRASLTQDDPDA